jgi:hypothetical protein
MSATEQSPEDPKAERIDRLVDAIDMIRANRREEARAILSAIIGDDSNFEDAWLWMSVAVDSLDQAAVCLDNVLRINPRNYEAAGALYRIRVPEIAMEKRRARLRFSRDMFTALFWILVVGVMFAVIFSLSSAFSPEDLPLTPTTLP